MYYFDEKKIKRQAEIEFLQLCAKDKPKKFKFASRKRTVHHDVRA